MLRARTLILILLAGCARTTVLPSPAGAGGQASAGIGGAGGAGGAPSAGGIGGAPGVSFGPTGGVSSSSQIPTPGSGGSGGSPPSDSGCVPFASRSCGGYGSACCAGNECAGEPCEKGLACCGDGRCSADCIGATFCAAACTQGAMPDEHVDRDCRDLRDGNACFEYRTGGYPSRCVWATGQWQGCDCERLDEASCESSGCVAQYAYPAALDRRSDGWVFAGCAMFNHACPPPEQGEAFTCTEAPDGELWVVPGECIPPSWKRRPGITCDAQGLECEGLDVASCQSSPWCNTIEGHTLEPDDAGSLSDPVGCTRPDALCSGGETCARANEGAPEYYFHTSCIPAGWIACEEP